MELSPTLNTMKVRKRDFNLDLERDINHTSFLALQNPLALNRFWILNFARVCTLGILSVSAFAEKGTLESVWSMNLSNHRNSLEYFEIWTETWRYEIFDSTSPISAEITEDWVDSVQYRISSATVTVDSRTKFSILVEETRDFFGSPPESAEVLSEVHQRDATGASYRVWERRSGDLSKYESQGTWHQSDGVIALGPPMSEDHIDIFLARLGVLIPESAKALEIPSSTPENEEERIVFQVDSEEVRYRYGCQPWRMGGTRPLSLEEFPMFGDEEGALSERRHFFRFSGATDNERKVLLQPEAALEFRFGARGELVSYAVIQIHPAVTDPAGWMPFPSSRPPFGWKVLDYRFLPETEFTFGETGSF